MRLSLGHHDLSARHSRRTSIAYDYNSVTNVSCSSTYAANGTAARARRRASLPPSRNGPEGSAATASEAALSMLRKTCTPSYVRNNPQHGCSRGHLGVEDDLVIEPDNAWIARVPGRITGPLFVSGVNGAF